MGDGACVCTDGWNRAQSDLAPVACRRGGSPATCCRLCVRSAIHKALRLSALVASLLARVGQPSLYPRPCARACKLINSQFCEHLNNCRPMAICSETHARTFAWSFVCAMLLTAYGFHIQPVSRHASIACKCRGQLLPLCVLPDDRDSSGPRHLPLQTSAQPSSCRLRRSCSIQSPPRQDAAAEQPRRRLHQTPGSASPPPPAQVRHHLAHRSWVRRVVVQQLTASASNPSVVSWTCVRQASRLNFKARSSTRSWWRSQMHRAVRRTASRSEAS